MSAGLGLLFAILATVTGAVFARIMWGAYWNWDPRQTSIVILLLILAEASMLSLLGALLGLALAVSACASNGGGGAGAERGRTAESAQVDPQSQPQYGCVSKAL